MVRTHCTVPNLSQPHPTPSLLHPPSTPCSKSVGHKFGKHLARGVPLCIRYLRGAAEGDEELREYCLQARGRRGGACLGELTGLRGVARFSWCCLQCLKLSELPAGGWVCAPGAQVCLQG